MDNGEDSEVVFREEEPEREESAPPTPITHCDMDVIIRGWEEKLSKLTECLREVRALTCASSVRRHVRRAKTKNGGWGPCRRASWTSCGGLRPRGPQPRHT